MSDDRTWFKGQRVRHDGHLTLGSVVGVDFEESLVAVLADDYDEQPTWWRMEHVIQVDPVPAASTA